MTKGRRYVKPNSLLFSCILAHVQAFCIKIKEVLLELVDISQCAFFPCREIAHIIVLCEELTRSYTCKHGLP